MDLRDAQPCGRVGEHAGIQRERPDDSRVRCSMQHRDEYKLFYRTTSAGCSNALPDPSPPAPLPTNNCFKPYTLGSAPADLATATTMSGLTVPYVVRVERG